MENCKFFPKGKCHRGDACPFPHVPNPTPCRFFKKGKCKKGDACHFSHEEELSTSASTSASAFVSVLKPIERRASDQALIDGGGIGEEMVCGEEAVAAVAGVAGVAGVAAVSSKIRKPCHFFEQGTCRNGDDCRFSHAAVSV